MTETQTLITDDEMLESARYASSKVDIPVYDEGGTTMERQIFCTYDVVTTESAEHGDFADHGWYENGGLRFAAENKPETGHSCEPDEFDLGDDLTAVNLAVSYLSEKGVSASSNSRFHPGTWYSTESTIEDYSTDEHVSYSFHLEGFSEAEERAVYNGIMGNA